LWGLYFVEGVIAVLRVHAEKMLRVIVVLNAARVHAAVDLQWVANHHRAANHRSLRNKFLVLEDMKV